MVSTPEETGIGENLLTAEVNKCVAEVLEWQHLGQSNCRCTVTVHSEEALGEDWEVRFDQWNSFSKEAFHKGARRESIVRNYKQLHKKIMTILATSLPFHRRSEDDHLRWEKVWTPKSRSTYVLWLAGTAVSCSLALAAT